MLVREIVLNALSRLGIAKHGVAPADQMEKAERIIGTALKTYSGDDVITAFQRVTTAEISKDETTIGAYVASRGKRIYELTELPDAGDYTVDRDFVLLNGKTWYRVTAASTGNTWVECLPGACCDFVPDIIVTDMERIVSIRVKTEHGWVPLRRTNLAQFDPEDESAYVANPDGVKRERLYTSARGTCRIVYNTSMSGLTMNSNVDLPEPYMGLIELSVCVGCARTQEQLARFSAELSSVENNVATSNTSERVPVRDLSEEW